MTEEVAFPLDPAEVLAKMDRTLLYVARRHETAHKEVRIVFGEEFQAVRAADTDEFQHFLRTLVARGLVSVRGDFQGSRADQYFRLTPEGWAKAEQLIRAQPHSTQAFVAMWFTKTLKPAWERGFEPALRASGFNPVRIDLVQHNSKIDDVIISEIRRSGLLVADFTGNRGGVYFEAGFAMGLGIPVIWTCREGDIGKVHFDTRQYSHVLWNDPADLREKLEYRIRATVGLPLS